MTNLFNRTRLVAMVTILFAATTLVGCSDDSSISDPDTGNTFTIEGRVTDDASYAKRGDVDDAQVRAEDLDEDGRRSDASESSSTDENGSYTLQVSGNTEMYVVTATKGDFESSTLVMTDGSASVNAPAMNTESHATAAVYTEAKRQDSDSRSVTAADVALHMNADLASSIDAGTASASEVAAAIRTAAEAEASYHTQYAGDSQSDLNARAELEGQHFMQLQANLAANANVEASWQTFLSAMVEGSANTQAEMKAAAEARQAASIAIENMTTNMNSNAQLALRKQAAISVAHATDLVVTNNFQSTSEWQADASAAAQAGASLKVDISNASSQAELNAAWATYESDIEGILSAGLSLGTIIEATLRSNIDTLKGEFSSEISGSTDADAMVAAHQSFKADIRSELESRVSSSVKADVAAEILALVVIK